jgi:hypothetical protein
MAERPGTTFLVSNVLPATAPLLEVAYREAIEQLLLPEDLFRRLNTPEPAAPSYDLAAVESSLRKSFPKDPAFVAHIGKILTDGRAAAAKAQQNEREQLQAERRQALGPPIEAVSDYRGTLVDGVRLHPLLAALHLGFVGHRPVSLSPDIVWLTLCQGVVHHLRANSNEVASRIGIPLSQAAIRVRRDEFVKGSPENPWPEVFAELATRAVGHLGTADLFSAEFSTTGVIERAVRDVLLLGALQPFCSYTLRTLCGIPSLTLEGTADDWRLLTSCVRRFAALGLEWWVILLLPLLEQFVAAAEGRVEKEFWRSIYKYHDGSGRYDVHGWITLFFPYLKDDGDGTAARPNRVAKEAFDLIRSAGESPAADGMGCPTALDWRSLCELLAKNTGDHGPAGVDADEEQDEDPPYLQAVVFPDERDSGYGGIRTGHFPGGLVRVPLTWAYLNTEYPMEFLAGFVGVRQNRGTLHLRPEIGWAVRQSDRGPQPPVS